MGSILLHDLLYSYSTVLNPILWADIVLCIHFLYVFFCIIGVPLIFLGEIFRWSWTRHTWFRNIHIGIVTIVAVQALLHVICPWTILEEKLRLLGGEEMYGGAFMGYWIGRLLYYNIDPSVFTVLYCRFFILTLTLYALFPPHKRST